MSKPSVLAVAQRLAPSINSAILLKVDDIHQPNNALGTEADNYRFELWLD
jgi:hypothetical protein